MGQEKKPQTNATLCVKYTQIEKFNGKLKKKHQKAPLVPSATLRHSEKTSMNQEVGSPLDTRA